TLAHNGERRCRYHARRPRHSGKFPGQVTCGREQDKKSARTARSDQEDMAQRIAYVTGGMGGIGTAICKRLCNDGFRVIAGCGPNSPRKNQWLDEMRSQGYEVLASEGNVADWDSTHAAFDRVKAEVGVIDVLVNNAGITRDVVFHKMSRADWESVISTN